VGGGHLPDKTAREMQHHCQLARWTLRGMLIFKDIVQGKNSSNMLELFHSTLGNLKRIVGGCALV